MSKRIPKQSNIPGFSAKAWYKFITSLSDGEYFVLENHFKSNFESQIHTSINDIECGRYKFNSDCAPDCCGCGIQQKMIQSGYRLSRMTTVRESSSSSVRPSFISPDSVPSPRLVGIELNPGPDGKMVVFTEKSKGGKKSNININVKKASASKSAGRPRGQRSSQQPQSTAKRLENEYIQTLSDPWEHGPLKLGYDTFVSTVLATGYRRSSFIVNVDGSFSIVIMPSISFSGAYNISGLSGTTYTSFNCSNLTAIQNQSNEGRVVSGGLRVMALFPRTSAPGVLFTGIDVSSSYTNLTGLSPNVIAGLPQAEISVGSSGSTAVMRPLDNDSYSFSTSSVLGYAATDAPTTSSLFIAGMGFPVGTVIWYEFILNLELLPKSNATSVGISPNDPPTTSISDYFPSPTSLFNRVIPYLGNAVTFDAGLGVAEAIGIPYASGARRALRSARSAFGNGAHYRRSFVSGQQEMLRGRQNTVLIEEMKDGF